jgi:hypothetical protein
LDRINDGRRRDPKDSICFVADEQATVGWRDVWAVVRASAEKRLGRPLLMAYLMLALVGIAVVAGAVFVMRL